MVGGCSLRLVLVRRFGGRLAGAFRVDRQLNDPARCFGIAGAICHESFRVDQGIVELPEVLPENFHHLVHAGDGVVVVGKNGVEPELQALGPPSMMFRKAGDGVGDQLPADPVELDRVGLVKTGELFEDLVGFVSSGTHSVYLIIP